MTTEAKVGAFVLAGLILLGWAIFLLGDVSLQRHYQMTVYFDDVSGLPKKSVVKLNGVEVGKVKDITLEGNKARVDLAIQMGVKIYKDAKFRIASTSIIGSKFLAIEQGESSEGEPSEGS
ncbi:MAG: MCE family protein [Elusimicrobia bacterium]|nr:MCE family protein [Elusimicrobiota bacterium]